MQFIINLYLLFTVVASIGMATNSVNTLNNIDHFKHHSAPIHAVAVQNVLVMK